MTDIRIEGKSILDNAFGKIDKRGKEISSKIKSKKELHEEYSKKDETIRESLQNEISELNQQVRELRVASSKLPISDKVRRELEGNVVRDSRNDEQAYRDIINRLKQSLGIIGSYQSSNLIEKIIFHIKSRVGFSWKREECQNILNLLYYLEKYLGERQADFKAWLEKKELEYTRKAESESEKSQEEAVREIRGYIEEQLNNAFKQVENLEV